MGEFSSSEEEVEEEEQVRVSRDDLRVDFINLYRLGLCDCLALSALPGCRFRDVQRNLKDDMESLLRRGITHVMVLMEETEFRRYRVPGLLQEYSNYGLQVLHHALVDGSVPSLHQLFLAVENIKSVINGGGRLLVHCYGGLGRTCLVVAAFLMSIDPHMTPEYVIDLLREKRGPRAVQTVRQYNMIMEFRAHQQHHRPENAASRSRSVSR